MKTDSFTDGSFDGGRSILDDETPFVDVRPLVVRIGVLDGGKDERFFFPSFSLRYGYHFGATEDRNSEAEKNTEESGGRKKTRNNERI